MGDGLDAAAGEVEVRDRVRVEDGKGVQALGRQVHVAAVGRCRCNEEHALGGDEGGQLVGDRVENPAHYEKPAAAGTCSVDAAACRAW